MCYIRWYMPSINLTIISMKDKPIYLETNNKLTRHKLDLCTGHIKLYNELLELYNYETNTKLNKVDLDLSKYG